MTRRMQVSEMSTYTLLSHSLFPQDPDAASTMALWCEDTIGPMDENWAITVQPTTPGDRQYAVWVFRNANDALAFSLNFRGP